MELCCFYKMLTKFNSTYWEIMNSFKSLTEYSFSIAIALVVIAGIAIITFFGKWKPKGIYIIICSCRYSQQRKTTLGLGVAISFVLIQASIS